MKQTVGKFRTSWTTADSVPHRRGSVAKVYTEVMSCSLANKNSKLKQTSHVSLTFWRAFALTGFWWIALHLLSINLVIVLSELAQLKCPCQSSIQGLPLNPLIFGWGLLGARPAHLRQELRASRWDNQGFPGTRLLRFVVCGWPMDLCWPFRLTLLACWIQRVRDIKYHSMLWEVVASTWARDSHDLFDFEASQLQTCLVCLWEFLIKFRAFSRSSHSPKKYKKLICSATWPHGKVLGSKGAPCCRKYFNVPSSAKFIRSGVDALPIAWLYRWCSQKTGWQNAAIQVQMLTDHENTPAGAI